MSCEVRSRRREFVAGCSRTAAIFLLSGLGVSGCRRPHAILPPSLDIPAPVRDLASVRADDQVSLH
jgi:hypothetical protein